MSRKRRRTQPAPHADLPSPRIWPVLQTLATFWGIGRVCPNAACRRAKACTWTHPTCFEREPEGFRFALRQLKPALDRRAAEIAAEEAAEEKR